MSTMDAFFRGVGGLIGTFAVVGWVLAGFAWLLRKAGLTADDNRADDELDPESQVGYVVTDLDHSPQFERLRVDPTYVDEITRRRALVQQRKDLS